MIPAAMKSIHVILSSFFVVVSAYITAGAFSRDIQLFIKAFKWTTVTKMVAE